MNATRSKPRKHHTYQRLDAKKALIGITYVAYLQNQLGRDGHILTHGKMNDVNKKEGLHASLTFEKSFSLVQQPEETISKVYKSQIYSNILFKLQRYRSKKALKLPQLRQERTYCFSSNEMQNFARWDKIVNTYRVIDLLKTKYLRFSESRGVVDLSRNSYWKQKNNGMAQYIYLVLLAHSCPSENMKL